MIKEMNSDEEADFALALQLQNDIMDIGDYDEVYASPRRNSDGKQVHSSEAPLSIVDDSWELIDPVPDIRELFVQFNEEYFEGKLAGVEVRWSPRMTLCAGLCCYEGRGGLCSIRLSQPLLKLRPRRDLVQTLLHEMIHALLFVTNNNKDHDSHGPEFHKHMDRINKSTGSKITVYHTFHDEVDEYRQHWWRCNGPCVRKRPFFGIVRRAMNRAPSPRDPWWADHRAKCGGDFIKIKEPDGYAKKPSKKNASKQDVAELKSSAASKQGDDGARAVITDWFKRDGGSASAGSDSTIPSLKRKTFSQSSSSISSGIPPLLNGDAAKRQATQRNIRTLNDFGVSESFQSGGGGDTSLGRGVLSRNCDQPLTRFPGTGHVLGSASSCGLVLKKTHLAPLSEPPVSNSQLSRSSVVTVGGRASTLSHAATTEVSSNAKVATSALHGSAVAVDIDSDDKCVRRAEAGGKACANAWSELAVVQCPACMQTIPEDEINLHLDTCLTS